MDQIAAARTDVLFVASYVDDAVSMRKAILAKHVPLVANIGTSSSYCLPAFGEQLGQQAVGLFASDKPDGDILKASNLTPEAASALAWGRAEYAKRYGGTMTAAALTGFAGGWALFHHVLPAARALTPKAIAEDDFQRRIWRGLQVYTREKARPPLYLGWGETDSFARANGLLARELPKDHIFTAPGGLSPLLEQSDFVVITLPLTLETEGLIDEAALAHMKKAAYLINISRGPIVKENALIRALRKRSIAGAAVDVFKQEPLPSDSAWYRLENVIITPHISGAFDGMFERATALFLENLKRYRAGEELFNVADRKRGY